MKRQFPEDLNILDVLCSCFEKNETFMGGWVHRIVPFASAGAAKAKYEAWLEDLRVMLHPVEIKYDDDPEGRYWRATFTSDDYPAVKIKYAGTGVAVWVAGQFDVMIWWMETDLWLQKPHPSTGLYSWEP